MSDNGTTVEVKLGFLGTFIYLTIGLLYHIITLDVAFSWTEPWLYIDMVLWPFFLIGWIILCFLILAAIALVVVFTGDGIGKWKRKREKEERDERERRRIARATPPQSK